MNGSSVPDTEPCNTFEWTLADGPSYALVAAMSELLGEDPQRMEPLYHSLDPESLDRLFGSVPVHRSHPTGSVQFEYADYHVVINENGRGYIHEQSKTASKSITVENSIDADDD